MSALEVILWCWGIAAALGAPILVMWWRLDHRPGADLDDLDCPRGPRVLP